MEYITPEVMAREEQRASAAGVGIDRLMENAGAEVAREVERRFGPVSGKRIVVIAGSGNNGGDGFVAARQLATRGSRVEVILLSNPQSIKTTEAGMNWGRLADTSVRTFEAEDGKTLAKLAERVAEAEILIDAIFGTGIKGEVKEPHAEAIKLINQSGAKKVAIDIPSGLDPLTGEARRTTVRADVTVALHRPKVGLANRKDYTGVIVVVPIGIP